MSSALRCLVVALGLASLPAAAQWIDQPTPGIPRTKDGKPNLTAPTPRTPDGKPDLSGIWQMVPLRRNPNAAAAVPSGTGNGGLKNYLPEGETIAFLPWAEKLYKERIAANGIGLPSDTACRTDLPAL